MIFSVSSLSPPRPLISPHFLLLQSPLNHTDAGKTHLLSGLLHDLALFPFKMNPIVVFQLHQQPEASLAATTRIQVLPEMLRPTVLDQVVALGKRPFAELTFEGLFSGMNPLVTGQVVFVPESLLAHGTPKLTFFSVVNLPMFDQAMFHGEASPANIATKGTLLGVNELVIFERSLRVEPGRTLAASEPLLGGMTNGVLAQVASVVERLAAGRAEVGGFSLMNLLLMIL